MKYLKKYRLFESVNEEEIHSICKEYGIKNYTINGDGTIDVAGDVDLFNKGLTKLPLKFRNVSGDFYCNSNQLKSLEGAPQSVGGSFKCHVNQLITLEGAPQSVGGEFWCNSNQLKSLEGTPQSVGGGFFCENNQLTSLEGAPQSVGGSFKCDFNKLTNLKGTPNSIGGGITCYNNKIMSLDGLEYKNIKGFLDLRENPIYPIVGNWIDNDNRDELIEYFVDLSVIQGNRISKDRLFTFYDEMDLLGLNDSGYELF